MGINLISPAGFTSAVLIADTAQATNGSNDCIAQITRVDGQPVAAALEIQSTEGSLLIPRMTTAERNALDPVVEGMMIYNNQTDSFDGYFNAGWTSISGGSAEFDRIYVGDGTEALPSVAFTADTDTGIYRIGANTIGFSGAAVTQFEILGTASANNYLYVTGGDGVSPTIGVSTDSATANLNANIQARGTGAVAFVATNGSADVGKSRWYTETNAKYFEWTAPINADLGTTLSFEWPRAAPVTNNTPFVANIDGTTSFNSAGFLSFTTSITAAQVRGMFAAPIEILSALGGTSTYVVHAVKLSNVAHTIAFADGGVTAFHYGSINVLPTYSATTTISAAELHGGTSNNLYLVTGLFTPTASTAVAGEGIYLSNQTGAFTGGDGTFLITIWYSIVSVTA